MKKDNWGVMDALRMKINKRKCSKGGSKMKQTAHHLTCSPGNTLFMLISLQIKETIYSVCYYLSFEHSFCAESEFMMEEAPQADVCDVYTLL